MPKKFVDYRPAKLKKSGNRLYVEFYYRIPEHEAHKHKEKVWKRFRIFANINRYKSGEYAKELLDGLNAWLDKGKSPFKDKTPEIKPADTSLNKGLEEFINYCSDKGLRSKSLQTYGTCVKFLKEYFLTGNKLYQPVQTITKQDIRAFLSVTAEKKKWTNTTYNKTLGTVRIIFNWFVKEEKLGKSPCIGIEEKIAIVTKHAYYDDETAERVKKYLAENNSNLNNLVAFVYYTATRPKSETRLLKVEHILFDRKLLFVPASISKNKKDDLIPLSDECIELLDEMNVRKYPKHYYIFSPEGKPAEKPASVNYFSEQFRVLKPKMKLSDDHTIYGFKHLRAIHLAQDGANHYDIMRLFRHSSLEMTQKYLRNLGLTDFTDVLKKGRKY